ncbi:MAG: hypothetical protein DWB45_02285 [Xanthomonadales bacterium]|nr:hypothetical protein [Xanthomonadales bacterium]MDL1868534.1 hypothetical protein [Gammaproteobacteria bacterium PRO6]
MSPGALLETAALMGLFVLAGGAYGGLYSMGRLRARPHWVRAGQACWLLAFAIAVLIALRSPLDLGWKLLILASAMVYAVIPPVTWRYLQRLHAHEETQQ